MDVNTNRSWDQSQSMFIKRDPAIPVERKHNEIRYVTNVDVYVFHVSTNYVDLIFYLGSVHLNI